MYFKMAPFTATIKIWQYEIRAVLKMSYFEELYILN